MAISKRLRFEVFKRDGFRCRYCGAGVLDVTLHCDHVVPDSKGGPTTAENLVTACQPCNLGKSNIGLDERKLSPSIDVADAKEHATQIRAYLKIQKQIGEAKSELEDLALAHWKKRIGDWHSSLPNYLHGPLKDFGLAKVMEAIDIVASRDIRKPIDQVKYLCGIIKNWRDPKPRPAQAASVAQETAKAADSQAAVAGAQWEIVDMLFSAYWEHRSRCGGPTEPILQALKKANAAGVSWQDVFLAVDMGELYSATSVSEFAARLEVIATEGPPDEDYYVYAYKEHVAAEKQIGMSMLWSVWGRFVNPHPRTHQESASQFPLVAGWFSELYDDMGHAEAAMDLLLTAGPRLSAKTDAEQQALLRDITRADQWASQNHRLMAKWAAE